MPADDDLMSIIDGWAAQPLIQNDKPNVQEESKIKKHWRIVSPSTGLSGKKFDRSDATPRLPSINNLKWALASSAKYGRVQTRMMKPGHFYRSLLTATGSYVPPNACVPNDFFCSYSGNGFLGHFPRQKRIALRIFTRRFSN